MRFLTTPLRRPVRFSGRQQGAVLVMAMLIVVLILMAGIAATSNSNSQVKQAGIFESEDVALNNAENAITDAEAWLGSGSNYLSNGFAVYDAAATPQLLPIGFTSGPLASGRTSPASLGLRWPDAGIAASAIGVGGDPAQQYVIEQISGGVRLPGSSQVLGGRIGSGCNQVNTYQITARGRDPRGTSRLVQTNFAVLHCTD